MGRIRGLYEKFNKGVIILYHELLREQVLEKVNIFEDISKDQLLECIEECVLQLGKEKYIPLKEKERLKKELYDSFRGFDVLSQVLEDENVSEIMVNSFNEIFIEKEGRIYPYEKSFQSQQKLEDIVQQMVALSNKRINEANPIVDFCLEDGSRVNIVLPPVSIHGPTITIRKFSSSPFSMERLIEIGAITREAATLLEKLVKSKYNIFVSGGTGSGKTTFLGALSQWIPKEERVITIEDAPELTLHTLENVVRLLSRQSSVEGQYEITIRDLIRSALRMRPNRIIVGEIRSEEALDMLQAMNTGHEGSLSTGHGNSPKDMLSRIETMVLMGMEIPINAIRSQIAGAIDIMVHLSRMPDKSRKVVSIDEIIGMENGEIMLNPIYKLHKRQENDSHVLEKVGNIIHTEKLKREGYLL